MNIGKLSWSYLGAKPLSTLLNVVLFTLGIAIIVILLLFNYQLENKLSTNTKGIDLVVGAKGSPMQLILCNIFHIDFPTGNIPLFEAEKLTRQRLIENAIPLALGDSYKGYRIVGTTSAYRDLYDVSLEDGEFWKETLDVTLGARAASDLGLSVGDRFASQHGLSAAAHEHEGYQFVVRGILEPSGKVVDNLILTNIESIWLVHEEGESSPVTAPDEAKIADSRLIPGLELYAGDSALQITSMLIQFRSPMGAVMLPRYINENTSMQAASPAFETARLFSLVGVGMDVMEGFAFIIIFIAALSIFIALYNSLKERQYDLAIMRSMGATKSKLFFSIILEGLWITVIGCMLGYLTGHATLELVRTSFSAAESSGITGRIFIEEEFWVLGSSVVIGLVAAIIPALQVFRADISKILARG